MGENHNVNLSHATKKDYGDDYFVTIPQNTRHLPNVVSMLAHDFDADPPLTHHCLNVSFAGESVLQSQ